MLGRISAEGSGLAPSYRQDRWRVGADAGAAVRQHLHGGWSVGLEARLIVPFLRDRVTVSDSTGQSTEVFGATPVGGAAVLFVELWPKWPVR